MQIVTYFQEIGNEDDQYLLEYFIKVWDIFGVKVGVLSEQDAKEHSAYQDMLEKIKTLPTTNGQEYEKQCYLRWLAVAEFPDKCVFADYDVFPNMRKFYSLISTDRFLNYTHAGNPGMINGKAKHWQKIIELLLNYKVPPETEHVSDLTIFTQYASNLFQDRLDWIKCHNETGWENSPLIHFANGWKTKGDDRTRAEIASEVLGIDLD